MPYARNNDLPPSVRSHLPARAQDIYREAFNNAWKEYIAREPSRIEEIAHRVAWFAVKRKYRKDDGEWVPISAIAYRPLRNRRGDTAEQAS